MEVLLTKTPHSIKIQGTVFLRGKMGYYTYISYPKLDLDTSFFSRMSLTNASECSNLSPQVKQHLRCLHVKEEECSVALTNQSRLHHQPPHLVAGTSYGGHALPSLTSLQLSLAPIQETMFSMEMEFLNFKSQTNKRGATKKMKVQQQ